MSNRKRSGKLVKRPKPSPGGAAGGSPPLVFPASITATKYIWVDASQQTGYTDNAVVTTVTNLANTDKNFPTDGGNKAIYIENGKNSLPVFRSSFTNFPSSYTIPGGNGQRIFVGNAGTTDVLYWCVMKNNGMQFNAWNDQFGTCAIGYNYTGNCTYFYSHNTSFPQSNPIALATATDWAIFVIRRDASGDNFKFYLNGNSISNYQHADGNFSFLTLGINGDLCESGFCSYGGVSSPTTPQVNDLGNYLSQKWGIPWTTAV